MRRFTLPRDIYYGKGSIEVLGSLEGKRAIIVVGGGSMKKLGFLDKVTKYLKKAGIKTELFENVEVDPSVETVMRGAEAMHKFKPDLIVSIGGGSAIDAAKAMWIFYEHPDTKFEDIITPFSMPTLRQKAKFIAIPSTSGTATEVTAFSVITDYSKGIKYPLADYNITPDIAILDSTLADSMPKSLTAYTGLDALTHAIEAYVSTAHSPFTDPLALKAIAMTVEHLVKSYGGDVEAREQMHYAQCLAGMAFSNALLGIVHAMAHKTGAVFGDKHLTHGLANAMYLPYVIRFNATKCPDRYADIAKAIGLYGASYTELINNLVDKITALNTELGIPKSLKEWGLREEEFSEKLDYIVSNALSDACVLSNPREINADEMTKLFKCIYYGEEVNF